MSFILDALQRAQKAHDQSTVQTTPILADRLPDAPANLQRRALWLAMAVLVAGAIALIAWWLGRESVAPVAPRTPASQVASTPVTAAPTARRDDRPPVRSLDQEVARAAPARQPATATTNTTSDADIQQAVDAGATLITPRPKPARDGSVTIVPSDGARNRVTAVTPPPAADPGDGLPAYENLLRGGKINLPNLKMDMHVYNQQPKKRFVFVNFKKYREGDKLNDDTTIEEITGSGAVLNHNGQRFLLRPN